VLLVPRKNGAAATGCRVANREARLSNLQAGAWDAIVAMDEVRENKAQTLNSIILMFSAGVSI
jgi:hypothetical protein